MIHTWFAQLALLASGLGAEMLPNPEILDPASLQDKPEEEKAYKALSFAEDLLKAMRTNVNDELALRTKHKKREKKFIFLLRQFVIDRKNC